MKWKFAVFLLSAALWLAPLQALHAAGGFSLDGELSVMGSYSKTDYGNNAYSTTKRYTATLGINITPTTEIEVSYGYSDSFINYDPIQTTSINEQNLGISLVQSLVPKSWVIQPYVKAGAAQYNRKQSGTVAGIPTNPTQTKSPSGILGGGIRIYLLRNFSLKVEGVAYLPNMNMSRAINNLAIQGGVGWHF